MKATDLLRFVLAENLEYHWHEDDVILFVPDYQMGDFKKILTSKNTGLFDEEGIKCTMRDNYFAFEMEQIVGYFGIDLEDIFKKEE